MRGCWQLSRSGGRHASRCRRRHLGDHPEPALRARHNSCRAGRTIPISLPQRQRLPSSVIFSWAWRPPGKTRAGNACLRWEVATSKSRTPAASATCKHTPGAGVWTRSRDKRLCRRSTIRIAPEIGRTPGRRRQFGWQLKARGARLKSARSSLHRWQGVCLPGHSAGFWRLRRD